MNHWSVDQIEMKKRDPESFAVWNLEHAINYGLHNGPLKKTELIKYWDRLQLDIDKRRFLTLLLKNSDNTL